MKKHPIHRSALRVRAYPVLASAVSASVAYGWNRAHKHTDKPSTESIKAAIEQAVMSEICEAFAFEEDE